MMDFLKAYPFITMEQYMWGLSISQIQIMSNDASRVIYLTEKQAKQFKNKPKSRKQDDNKVFTDPDEFAKALGIPTFNI